MILIFGEDHSDRAAIAHLIRAALPVGVQKQIRPLRKPIILARDAHTKRRSQMADEVAAFSKGFEKTFPNTYAIVHRDCDDYEPSHVELGNVLETQLKKAGVKRPIAATPAWEIESWWMLFPTALNEVRPCWRKVDYGMKQVGKIRDAKEQLTRDLRPVDAAARSRCHDYQEADGVRVAELVAKDQNHMAQIKALSESFQCFLPKVQSISA